MNKQHISWEYVYGIIYYNLRKYIVPLILFSFTTIVAGWFARIGVDPHHDGILFKPALDVLNGSVLFRDTFTQYGALTTFIQSAVLFLFGPYVLAIRLFTAVCYGLIAVSLYFISMKLVPAPLSALTVILWILSAPYYYWNFLPWSSVYALLFQLLGTYLLMKFAETNTISFLFWTGVATACTFLTRQPGGVFMALAIMGFLLVTSLKRKKYFPELIRRLFIYFVGIGIVLAPFAIWLSLHHATNDFLRQSIQFAYNFGMNRPNTMRTALFPGGFDISLWSLFPFASIIVGLVSLVQLTRKVTKRAIMMLAVTAIGLSAWTQYYPVPDDRHFYWGATGMYPLLLLATIILVTSILTVFRQNNPRLVQGISAIVLIVLFIPTVSIRMVRGWEKLTQPYDSLQSPTILRGLFVPPDEARFYASVADAMNTYFRDNPQGNVVNLSIDALYTAFDPRIRNTHPLFVNWYVLFALYPDFTASMNAYIEQHRPLVIGTNTILPRGYCPIAISPTINEIVLSKPCP